MLKFSTTRGIIKATTKERRTYVKKKLTIGILAHVDAGKTTLSEAMLYLCGKIRTIGRVDHRKTYLDTNVVERRRT